MNITKPQMETLKLFPNGYLLAQGRFGNICAELVKKGLVRFEGHENGKRKFRLTEAGTKAIIDSASIKQVGTK